MICLIWSSHIAIFELQILKNPLYMNPLYSGSWRKSSKEANFHCGQVTFKSVRTGFWNNCQIQVVLNPAVSSFSKISSSYGVHLSLTLVELSLLLGHIQVRGDWFLKQLSNSKHKNFFSLWSLGFRRVWQQIIFRKVFRLAWCLEVVLMLQLRIKITQ